MRSPSRDRTSLWMACFSLPLLAVALSSTKESPLAQKYAQARDIRLRYGHEAALPLYKELFEENPNDVSAATQIALCRKTPARHDAACPVHDLEKIHKLRQLLLINRYDNPRIQKLFGISENHKLAFSPAPIYLTPASAGSVARSPSLSENKDEWPLQCLVSLFLLGISVHCDVLSQCLGTESIQLFQDLGLAFRCETDFNLLVPYVHLFPMQVPSGDSLFLVTDLHPRVLSTTTVGTNQLGAVMYIGPDSLALTRNLPLSNYTRPLRILDLCTGSGVQALAALLNDNASSALCVDINERALRFVEFNAALNGLKDQVTVRQADLVAETTNNEKGSFEKSLLDRHRAAIPEMDSESPIERPCFDMVLANPPFIPVPPNDVTILQRYGLFSSGGPDGEDVLKVIVQLASKLLATDGGLLGIVSEFMNPPTVDEPSEKGNLLGRIQDWWSNGPGGRGILLTNEFPVDAETYGTRRADSRNEQSVWLRHLSELGVTRVSPGLLFMKTDHSQHNMTVTHPLVPKSPSGSLWTPSNQDAVVFTQECLQTIHPDYLGEIIDQ